MDWLINLDRSLLLALNGSSSSWLDGVMWLFSDPIVWIPLFLMTLITIYRSTDRCTLLLFVVFAVLCVVFADQISSTLMKPYFHRWRPTHDPVLEGLVKVVRNRRGGNYGFVSSHAANSFAIFTFVALSLRKKQITFVHLAWALCSSYSRIYLGLHFPGDVLCGALLGVAVGYLCSLGFRYLRNKLSENGVAPKIHIPNYYAYLVLGLFILTYGYIGIRGIWLI